MNCNPVAREPHFEPPRPTQKTTKNAHSFPLFRDGKSFCRRLWVHAIVKNKPLSLGFKRISLLEDYTLNPIRHELPGPEGPKKQQKQKSNEKANKAQKAETLCDSETQSRNTIKINRILNVYCLIFRVWSRTTKM